MERKFNEMTVQEMVEARIKESNNEVQEIILTYKDLPSIQRTDYMVNLIKDVDEYAFNDEFEALDILCLMDFRTYLCAQDIVFEEESIEE